jgi:hypothetical protein
MSLALLFHPPLEHQDDQVLPQTLEEGMAKGAEFFELVNGLCDAKYPQYEDSRESRQTGHVERVQRSLWARILPSLGSFSEPE